MVAGHISAYWDENKLARAMWSLAALAEVTGIRLHARGGFKDIALKDTSAWYLAADAEFEAFRQAQAADERARQEIAKEKRRAEDAAADPATAFHTQMAREFWGEELIT